MNPQQRAKLELSALAPALHNLAEHADLAGTDQVRVSEPWTDAAPRVLREVAVALEEIADIIDGGVA